MQNSTVPFLCRVGVLKLCSQYTNSNHVQILGAPWFWCYQSFGNWKDTYALVNFKFATIIIVSYFRILSIARQEYMFKMISCWVTSFWPQTSKSCLHSKTQNFYTYRSLRLSVFFSRKSSESAFVKMMIWCLKWEMAFNPIKSCILKVQTSRDTGGQACEETVYLYIIISLNSLEQKIDHLPSSSNHLWPQGIPSWPIASSIHLILKSCSKSHWKSGSIPNKWIKNSPQTG